LRRKLESQLPHELARCQIDLRPATKCCAA
jgi:hypothetical protein